MRSTNYSAKGNFSAAFKATARRRLPGMIIITVICGLVSAVGAFVQLSDYMYTTAIRFILRTSYIRRSCGQRRSH